MKNTLIFCLILLLLTSCQPNYEKQALELSSIYVESLGKQDLETQMELLKAFEMDQDAYRQGFLSYVESTHLQKVEIVHQDDFIIITEVKFEIIFKKEFTSEKLSPGKNQVTRYITFYKNKDMLIQEILDRLIK